MMDCELIAEAIAKIGSNITLAIIFAALFRACIG